MIYKHRFVQALVMSVVTGTSTIAGQAYGAAPLLNGGFELPVVVSPTNFERRLGTEMTNWLSIPSGSLGPPYGVLQFNSLFRSVSEGLQAVELEIPGDIISQTFATATGQSYLVQFDLSAYDSLGSLLGVTIGSLTMTFPGTNTAYTHYFFPFTADSTSATLALSNAGTLFTYPHIDNVSVTAIPEPSIAALWGVGLLGILGLTRYRRQGF